MEGEISWTSPKAASASILRRAREGDLMTWFESDRGRQIAFVTNGTRAMVMLIGADAAGEHAVDPLVSGLESGFVLDNGKAGAYPKRDTVTLDRALLLLEHVIRHGYPPVGAPWVSDQQRASGQ